MEVLNFEVSKKEIRCDKKQIIGGNDYQANFTLDEEWEDKEVICRVVWTNRTSLDITLEDSSCTIPAYMLKAGKITVGVYAESEENCATSSCDIGIIESIKEKIYDTSVPNKEIWKDIQDNIKNSMKVSEFTDKLNEYLDDEENVANLGLATLKNTLSHINVTFLGVDNTGATDNADLLQSIIDTVPSGTTLYFPTGVYLLSHGVTIDKSLQLIGDRKGRYLATKDDAKLYGSCLKFMDTVSDDTMITQGENSWSLCVQNMILIGNSGNFYDDGLSDETIPYAQYRYEIIRENVNGVTCIHHADINNCSFCFFSGYGLANSIAQNINGCKFYGNGIGVYVTTNDIMLRDCYITAGRIGIYCPKSKNIMIYDCYIDLLSEYGIYCEGYLSGYITGYIDHTNYSGIYANAINNLIVFANIYRTGMYYSGTALDDLKVSDDSTAELENFSKACAVSCSKMIKSNLLLGANSRPNDDAGTSSKNSPVIAVYITQAYTSVIMGAEVEVYVRVYTATDALTLIGNKGVVRYCNSFKRTILNVAVQSWSPTASQLAQNVGDLWYNSYKKEWYVATGITDSDTTWERQYTTAEIADIVSRLEVLENASATIE